MLSFRLIRAFNTKLIQPQLRASNFTENISEFQDAKVTSGKAWSAFLLRRKSHEDLVKLWFVLYKEQNLIRADNQLKVQLGSQKGAQWRMKKVKQSMARLLTVIREREIIRENYWKQLEAEYLDKTIPKEEPKPKIKRELTEEEKARNEKRKIAERNAKINRNWKKMSTHQRRGAIQAEYRKLAVVAKEEFLKELKYLGLKLREKGIKPKGIEELLPQPIIRPPISKEQNK
ncbi:unnamed protein product [Blepharisma stoltei]|uniref:Large ribosomal subunit protein uL29m n=1 Tax=Blepharisma stoltei TaxID=1481888 RepID=A0AAU9JHN4_9CILI|nr:unnamed protein product [Blepharisma stoltei]